MPAVDTEFTIRPNSACNDGGWHWVLAALGCRLIPPFTPAALWLALQPLARRSRV